MSKSFLVGLRNIARSGTQGVHAPRKSWVEGPRELGYPIINVFTGVVVSTKMQKTINVEVSQYVKHPVVHKYIKTTKRFMAHDNDEECNYGDVVEIRACRPISRKKHFILHRVIKPRPLIEWQAPAPTPFTHAQGAVQGEADVHDQPISIEEKKRRLIARK